MIRPAVPAEAGAVRAIAELAYAPWVGVIGRRPAPMDDDYQRHVDAGEVFVLEVGGAIAGLTVLIGHSDHLLLDNVAVDPSHSGRGLGRRLIGFAEAEASRRGYSELRLFTHARMTRNIRLYERLGFRETHRATVDGYDRVFMSKAPRSS